MLYNSFVSCAGALLPLPMSETLEYLHHPLCTAPLGTLTCSLNIAMLVSLCQLQQDDGHSSVRDRQKFPGHEHWGTSSLSAQMRKQADKQQVLSSLLAMERGAHPMWHETLGAAGHAHAEPASSRETRCSVLWKRLAPSGCAAPHTS
jgi:hypothetical protein